MSRRLPAVSSLSLAALLALVVLGGCQSRLEPRAPRRYLAITHPALNRVTFFDLDAGRVAGVLPAQKLPHDMLLSDDQRTLYVVSSGAQCITTYHLGAPELWREARAFMSRDTVRARRSTGSMFGMPERGDSSRTTPDSTAALDPHPRVAISDTGWQLSPGAPAGHVGGLIYLNPEPVQSLPPEVAEFHLTDPRFPDAARLPHARAGATEHRACFDCHERSLGAKPFGPVFSADHDSIFLVHLAGRNLTVLDAATLAIRRQVPLDLPPHLSPIEVWVRPGTHEAFVTCRNEIGQSLRGVIVVVDLETGATLATLTAGIYPWHLLPDPAGTRLFVNNFQSSRISVVDVAGRRIVDSLIVQNGPAVMLLSGDGGRMFVSCFYTHKVLEVEVATRRVLREVAVGSNPTSLMISQDDRTLLVLCGGESTLDEVDLATFLVRKRHPLLFGAYTFQLVDRDRPSRLAAAVGTLLLHHSKRGAGR